MINGIIRACFGLHFPETSGLWKGQSEKLLSNFRSLCFFFVTSYVWIYDDTVYQNRIAVDLNFYFCFKPSDLDEDQTQYLSLKSSNQYQN